MLFLSLFSLTCNTQILLNLLLQFAIERSLMYQASRAFTPSILLINLNFTLCSILEKTVSARIALLMKIFLKCTFILQSATEIVIRISNLNPIQLFYSISLFTYLSF